LLNLRGELQQAFAVKPKYYNTKNPSAIKQQYYGLWKVLNHLKQHSHDCGKLLLLFLELAGQTHTGYN
jgi:hypothetical protein